MHIIGYKSRKSHDFVIVDSKAGLPILLHLVSSPSYRTHASTSCRLTYRRYLRLWLYPVDSLDLWLVVDLPWLQPIVDLPQLWPSVDSPRLDFHYKEYNNPTFSHLLSSLLKQDIPEILFIDPGKQCPFPLYTKRTSKHSQTWSTSLLCFPTCLLSPIAPWYFLPYLLRNCIVHQCA